MKPIENMKKIFYFWEPRESLPGYLKLCIDTWQKNLPDYELIRLDYKNLYDYIDETDVPRFAFDFFSKAHQSDIIRMVVLNKYGGIYLDCDTIVTGPLTVIENKLSEYDMIMYGDSLRSGGIGVLMANAETRVIASCEAEMREKIKSAEPYFRRLEKLKKYKILAPAVYWYKKYLKKKIFPWTYFVDILDTAVQSASGRELFTLDINDICPERIKVTDAVSSPKKYLQFWFSSNYTITDIPVPETGLLALHNSWTPQQYRVMSEIDFLNTPTLLAQYLNQKRK